MTTRSLTERAEETGRHLVEQDRYVLVLVLILATVVSSAFLGEGRIGTLVPLGIMSVTMAVTLSTSDAGPRAVMFARVAVLLAFVGVLAAGFLQFDVLARLGYFLTMIVLSVVTPIVIARRLSKHLEVTVDTVAGAADIYLLVGLLFASVYTLIGAIQAGYWNSLGPANLLNVTPYAAFFNASRPTVPSDFIYYSYTTLSTVGYGDLTATSGLGRILSTTEALIGQLYLVTVVAILVGKMQAVRLDGARERARGRAASGRQEQLSEPSGSATPPLAVDEAAAAVDTPSH